MQPTRRGFLSSIIAGFTARWLPWKPAWADTLLIAPSTYRRMQECTEVVDQPTTLSIYAGTDLERGDFLYRGPDDRVVTSFDALRPLQPVGMAMETARRGERVPVRIIG